MKFALAVNGSRGDVEPHAAVALELQRRGHEVRIAVQPDTLGLVESAGLAAVAYGPSAQEAEDFVRNLWRRKHKTPFRALRAAMEYLNQSWAEMGTSLASLAGGADLLLTGLMQQGLAADVAEYHDIPLATLHSMPVRANGQLLQILPSPLVRALVSAFWRVHWGVTRQSDDALRRELGLPKATGSSTQRIVKRESLEIQAYDEFFFPGLAAEWAEWGDRRPFVGALTLELPTDADDEVLSWIAAGTPPIYFGFGSTPIRSPADTVAMIGAACKRLGERALIYSGVNDFSRIPHIDHVKIVGAVNYATIFPVCRAVVHHGGAGTTAAGMRAGVPTLVLWIRNEQPLWGTVVKRMKVGSAQRLSRTTEESLAAGLRSILTTQCVTRAREIATRMTKPSVSVTAAADLLENAVRRKRFS